MSIKLFYNTIPLSSVILEEDLCLRKEAYLTFLLEINNFITKKAIEHFQVNIENVVKHMDHICCCYGSFVDFLQLKSISNSDAVLIFTFETNILYCCNLDVYICCSGFSNFCYNYWTWVSRGKKPKLGIFNRML